MTEEEAKQIARELTRPYDSCLLIGSDERDLTNSIASALLEAARPKWRTIDTAPKDGTRILVTGRSGAFDAYWRQHGTESGEPGWVDDATNSYEEFYTYKPTHWMPLPQPPKDTPNG